MRTVKFHFTTTSDELVNMFCEHVEDGGNESTATVVKVEHDGDVTVVHVLCKSEDRNYVLGLGHGIKRVLKYNEIMAG